MFRPLFVLASLVALGVCFSSFAFADETEPMNYRTPPEPLATIVTREPTPGVSVDPGGESLLIVDQSALPPIAELAEPEIPLAGVRIDPATNSRSRLRYNRGLRLLDLATLEERRVVGFPEGARLGWPSWSPDGRRIAITSTEAIGVSLWIVDVETATASPLVGPCLNFATGNAVAWLPDSRSILCNLVPKGRGSPPERPRVPTGPIVRESAGRRSPARTYQDLLAGPEDEKLFDYYFSSVLTEVSLDGGLRALGAPAVIDQVTPSPDGRYILVHIVERPYSYLVPMSRFGLRVEVWDRGGDRVAVLADLSAAEEIPIAFGSVRAGRRSIHWRQDAPATVAWVEALDEGDADRQAELRDRVSFLEAPFDGEPTRLAELSLRYGGLTWGTDDLALLDEWWWTDRKIRTWIVKPGSPESAPRLLFDRSWEDRYSDPGEPVTRRTSQGTRVLRAARGGSALLFCGEGASPEGSRPFLDLLDLETLKTERLWRSEPPHYEFVAAVLDDDGRRLLTRRESRDESPDFFLRQVGGGEPTKVTAFPHPNPELAGMHKELLRYRRGDGVGLTATLYLPPGYDKERDGPLPLLVWAYPHEYKNAEAAGQIRTSPYQFDRVSWSSSSLWVLRGFAVLDDPTMPIVGEGDREPNDTYIEQLVASAEAAIDEVERMGVADRTRAAVVGHSYGAFTVANLLVHSNLFRAGIARSGAYNRTLTPFGFQAEERSLWDARDTYIRMSPFLHAHRIDEPLLLIHGDQDNNAGTYPLQSERLYDAVQGLGGTVRLVMLPHESHSYQARESVLHVLAETDAWLERHVKGRGSNRAP